MVRRNLKKIAPPEEVGFLLKCVFFLGTLLLESLLSWINVFVVIWQIFSGLIRVARDLVQAAPEAIKILRYPLRNNPGMSRESVWAYVIALRVRGGEMQPYSDAIVSSLNEIADYYPSFNKDVALQQLNGLSVLDKEIIDSAFYELEASQDAI